MKEIRSVVTALIVCASSQACMHAHVTTTAPIYRQGHMRPAAPEHHIPVTFTDRNQLPHGLAVPAGDSSRIAGIDRTPRIETLEEAAKLYFVYLLANGTIGAWVPELTPSNNGGTNFVTTVSFPSIVHLPFIGR